MPLIPLTWLADHVELPADLTAAQLAEDLVRVGLEEEEIHSSGVSGPVVVGQVVELTPEPQKNGKTINWCLVDVAQYNHVDEAGESQPRGIVCGAHNFSVGDRVVVALPGAELPGGFQISARKTYGHVSDGMICSARELGLGEDHSGIIVLNEDYPEATVGDDARALLGLADEVLEINVTPDRGYCFAMRGVAREYALSTGAKFTDRAQVAVSAVGGSGFGVQIDDAAPLDGRAGCDRFAARVVRQVAASAPSPAWLQERLRQAGMRPISLAVDVTNYVMLDLGQPMHAYDLSYVAEPIVVRRATPGEQVTTLDDQQRTLHVEDLLITDSPDEAPGSRVLGIAGVMGAANSAVSDTTVDLLLEAAHFDPISIARSARRHKLPSEAAKRFERGVDPLLPAVAIERAVQLLVEYGGGVADEALTDLDYTQPATPVELDPKLASRLLGVELAPERCAEILTSLGATVTPIQPDAVDSNWLVTPPSWRPDLQHDVDLVEEIARLHGYDQIPSVLPSAVPGGGLTRAQQLSRLAARHFAEAGLTEVLTYPFVGEEQFEACGIGADDPRRDTVKLSNPLAESRNQMRTSILLTLLEAARRNVGRGLPDVALFEVGQVTHPTSQSGQAPSLPGAVKPSPQDLADLYASVPSQPRHLAGVWVGHVERPGWWGPGRYVDFTDALRLVRRLAELLGVELVTVADTGAAPWHSGRCARFELSDGTLVAHAGQLHPKVLENFGLTQAAGPGAQGAIAFELNLDLLIAASPSQPHQAHPVSGFPAAKEDLALVVAKSVNVVDLRAAVAQGARSTAVGDVLEDLGVFDVFESEALGAEVKSVAFSLRLRAADRTLTAAETQQVREAAVQAAHAACGAKLRD